MNELFRLREQPAARELYLLAGWQQWADAGNISSGLPEYVIEKTGARRIGELNVGRCYLFQVPGTHHFLRPEIKLVDGHRESLARHTNDIYYTEIGDKGLVIFAGDEPHMDVDYYAEAFMAVVKKLGVRRVVALGGVYAPMPYDKVREVHCIYSFANMREELDAYAMQYSDYEGGVTISSYLADRAEFEGIEFVGMYGFVPAYDLSQLSQKLEGIRIESDYRAWYEIMRRLNYMFGFWIDLAELENKGDQLTEEFAEKLRDMDRKMPQLKMKEHLASITQDYTEMPFMKLDSMWANELGDILGKMDDES
jgi:proteasome assembly chaperone (PAC2) family protein